MKTAAELLIPRFEVIAEFPNMKSFNIESVGAVLTDDGIHAIKDQNNRAIFVIEFEKYPHLFRKMNWWEKREKEDMPKKLMSLADEKRETFDIEEWDMEDLLGWVNKEQRSCCSLLSWRPEFGYIPMD